MSGNVLNRREFFGVAGTTAIAGFCARVAFSRHFYSMLLEFYTLNGLRHTFAGKGLTFGFNFIVGLSTRGSLRLLSKLAGQCRDFSRGIR